MALGTPKTQKFQIGNAEVRIGNLSEVGKLTSKHSVGLVENVSVNFTQDSVDLEGGLPLTTYATVITKNGCTITADAKEFTARNMGILLNKDNRASENLMGADNVSSFDLPLTAPISQGTTAAVPVVVATDLTTVKVKVGSSANAPTTVTGSSAADTVYIVDANSNAVIYKFVPSSPVTLNSGVTNVDATLTSISYTFTTNVLTTVTLHVAGTLVAMAIGGQIKSATPSPKSGDVEAAETSTVTSATSLTSIVAPAPFVAKLYKGDLIVTYPKDTPENLSVVEVDIATGTTITLNPNTPLIYAASNGDVIYKTHQVGLGGNNAANYFTMDIISLDHQSSNPQGFRIWKAAVTSGLDYKFSATDFGSTNMAFKAMQPLNNEYDGSAGSTMQAMAKLANKHRYGFWFGA